MPDICMCPGRECPLKDKCYRYRAKAEDVGQVYYLTPPYKEGECRAFIDVEKFSGYRLETPEKLKERTW